MQLFWPERISSGSEEGEEGAEEDEAAARANQTCAIRKTISRLALELELSDQDSRQRQHRIRERI